LGGSLFLVVVQVTTLAHCDAVGWEPSTASNPEIMKWSVEVDTAVHNNALTGNSRCLTEVDHLSGHIVY
jgi:CDP-diacylglycerol pyrophosphatase